MIELILEDIQKQIPEYSLEGIKQILKKYIPDNPGYKFIHVRELAEKVAEKKFLREHSHIAEGHLYDISLEEGHGIHSIKTLKEQYNDIYCDYIDDYEEYILKFEA